MSKFLLSSYQVIEAEILKMEARRASILVEADDLKTAIKTLQKVVEVSPKKPAKKVQKNESISVQSEVKNESNLD